MRRPISILGLTLFACLAWSNPLSAQAAAGWNVQLEGRVGYHTSTRNLGHILGGEVDAQIETNAQPAPYYNFGFLLSGPSPSVSFRGSLGYMSTDVEGQAGVCSAGLSGGGCTTLAVPASSMQGAFDILLHRDTGGPQLLYFLAGLGYRAWSFEELDCRGIQDFNEFAVCSPMMELLADQKGLIGRLGFGFRRGLGPAGFGLEVVDQVGQFVGAGERGEGGIQNDFIVSVGVSFPGR